MLRSPVFEGRDFDKGFELHHKTIPDGINRASYAVTQQVDMTDVRELIFQLVTETPGTVIRLRADSPTGEPLGELAGT